MSLQGGLSPLAYHRPSDTSQAHSSAVSPIPHAPSMATGNRNGPEQPRDLSPPPAPSSRMALSALVNSPPHPPHREPSSPAQSTPVAAYPIVPPHYNYSPSSTASASIPPPRISPMNPIPIDRDRERERERDPIDLIDGPDQNRRGIDRYSAYPSSGRAFPWHSPISPPQVSIPSHRHENVYSPEHNGYEPQEPSSHSYLPPLRPFPWQNGGHGEPSRILRDVVPPPSLQGGEDVWEEALRDYQLTREREANDVAGFALEIEAEAVAAAAAVIAAPSSSKAHVRRKGWPSDHPTRVAAREAREAAIASGEIIPRRRPRKASRKDGKAAALEDELLGLAEGESASVSRSSLPPELGDDEFPKMGWFSSNIVQPSGLTREEVINKVEAGDMKGLTEEDVKTVQDEMWIRQKDANLLTRKDGTIRKKPGPAKGWKKLRGESSVRAGSSSARGDNDSDTGTSVAGDTVNGEAEAEINALLGDDTVPPLRAKRGRPKAEVEEDQGSDDHKADMSVDDLALSLLEDDVGGKKKKHREPGIGKGRWTRPPKEDKDSSRHIEALPVQTPIEDYDGPADPGRNGLHTDVRYELVSANPEGLLQMSLPNTEDPRGVSETEARVRFGLVEELQKQVWASICRDIPRMYRVYQAADSIIKQDCTRKAQAAVRNAYLQRTAKPTYRSMARINKDASSKAKKVIKEMLLYWRKNEKDELAARKKAEKEAMERAKAEEEAREAKRQSRKLNFLLTQTELYSHFIGKKIKTKEAEGLDGEIGDSDVAAHEDLALGANVEALPDIDYDDDNEENLRRHAARGAQAHVQAAKDKAKAFDDARSRQQADLDFDGDELNFQNPTLAEDSVTITQPKMLMAQLKEYQLKGLTWLGNLYEQGINGILADEMGLGKTIQSISLLAYLAEHHNLWGPFLVIAPASTLHNWQQELARFVPRLKALPYWGSPKDRETLRKIWNKKNMTFNEQSPFHILVTSYQLAVQDEKYFQGMRWQYMILDEAQAIKSSSSARWKSLLSLQCRNRLLLTGTPIQNSMHELWALLHFIMPSLFDSHEEFSEWFSKDIENAAGGGTGTLKPEQLRRLHMILKPFMLRRVKKHVQKELGDKIEIDLLVDLSQRQRSIYKALRRRVSISDLIAQANNAQDSLGAKNLMNLVMQFRKVCNHPDLFERADVVSPYVFGTFSQSGNLAREGDQLYCPDSVSNAIEVKLPKILWTDGGKLDIPGEDSLAGSDTKVLGSLMNIWSAGWINESIKKDDSDFGFLRIMGSSPGQVAKMAKAHPLVKLLGRTKDDSHLAESGDLENDEAFAASSGKVKKYARVPLLIPRARPLPALPALRDITTEAWNRSFMSRGETRFAVQSVVAPFIKPRICDRSFHNSVDRLMQDPLLVRAVYGVAPSERDDPKAVKELSDIAPGVGPLGLIGSSPSNQAPLSCMRVPPAQRLVVDSAKLARLDDLLRELKDGGHRVLLYFQMTKMMDLVEEYLIYRQYKYLRLDGSSPIGERRDMVTSWQTNPDIFVFCLSTRAGGLGINLTAADTVVFYDHDWNPSNDAQAMDRAHRVGQTKQVTVYRLIARGTIEERIVKMARAKKDVQDIVVGTKSLTDVAKPSEIVSLFMDDEELAESVAKRKQAEAHGYVAPATVSRPKSAFGDGLGINDEDEDDFFSLSKRPANTEDDDYGDELGGPPGSASASGAPGGGKAGKETKRSVSKRKASAGGDEAGGEKKPRNKKVKIALGADGLPI